ncbi:hypothetical protein CRM91_10920 [Burkholderia ambifaria]|nr:hypothetical protein CRM91_10920 [Burkholderia ambifaria]
MRRSSRVMTRWRMATRTLLRLARTLVGRRCWTDSPRTVTLRMRMRTATVSMRWSRLPMLR